MHRSVLILSLAALASIAVACRGSSASALTPVPTVTSDDLFDEADLRALPSNEEIEAAIRKMVQSGKLLDQGGELMNRSRPGG